MLSGDTIAAIATAHGRGGVAVVRVSGPDAFAIAERLTGIAPRGGGVSPLAKVAKIHSPQGDGIPFRVIDEAVVLSFRAPHSYTGEDVVEFQCHGGTVTPRRVLDACFAAGARPARRGEFTQRAFLNGKLDYEQAESVLDLIDAKTSRAADAALEGLSGRRRRNCRELYDQALDLSARLEHALDIDEGELPDGFLKKVEEGIAALRARLAAAIARANEGRILRAGALVVLAGPPNAGKSSLMNALLEESRAIVSDVPGTTRDSIEEWLDIDGWPVRLVDTAGLHETGDAIESEGVRRAEELVAKADVVVGLGGLGSLEGLGSLGGLGSLEGRLIRIHAKCDLGRGEGLNVSAKTGEGLEELKRAIVERIRAQVGASDAGDAPDGSASVFQEALSALSAQLVPLREDELVLAANALRGAAERLGAAIGATYSSDLLENLFSRFCVGK